MDIAEWWDSVAVWWNGDGWRWISEWMKSPGFAGFAAVVAATLAFAGARHQARLNAWWQRIEWALNLYTGSNSSQRERITGLAAIAALQQSRLARRGKQEFVRQIVDANTLDLFGDGADDDDLRTISAGENTISEPGDASRNGSYSDQEEKEATCDEK
ncbi:hypothetical protein AB0N61_11260 [Microbacterium sp. NPDC089320]|uniref:hypothetical protein n=1 Tax=Microbacterium sp. NPDC089320 TaxID=3155182 RepID=UPI0034469FD7